MHQLIQRAACLFNKSPARESAILWPGCYRSLIFVCAALRLCTCSYRNNRCMEAFRVTDLVQDKTMNNIVKVWAKFKVITVRFRRHACTVWGFSRLTNRREAWMITTMSVDLQGIKLLPVTLCSCPEWLILKCYNVTEIVPVVGFPAGDLLKLFSFFPWGPATEPWRMLCIDLETNRCMSRSFAEEGKLADAPNLSTATSSQESFTWTFLCTKHFGTTSLVQKYKDSWPAYPWSCLPEKGSHTK